MSPQKQHLGGLDGLRAIAVLAVIFYHLNISNFFSGGFLGVDIFFTLSGFLITSLLLREQAKNKTIDLKLFYINRMKRLLPAMLGMIVVCSVLVLFVAQDAASQLRKDIPAALLYYSNWWQIVREQSYFEMMNRPPLLQHLWSLAIEEQFYFFWPLVLLVMVRYGGTKGVLWMASAFALITSSYMFVLAVRHNIPFEADPNRLYLGADTHTSGLFAGAMLACLWNPWRMNFHAQKAYISTVFSVFGVLGLLVLCALFAWANETQAWLYRGGFLGVAFATVCVIMGATYRGGYLEKALSLPMMRYLGERSYGLYLWHWPIFVLIRPQDFVIHEWLTQILRLIVTLLAAELSYRYIETPFRLGKISTWQSHQQWRWLNISMAGILAVLVLYQRSIPVMLPTTTARIDTLVIAENLPSVQPIIASMATPSPIAAEPVKPIEMLAIGDSVMLGAKDYLRRGVPGMEVDAAVGRQGRDAIKLIRQLKTDGKLPARLLIHMGTNGYLPASQFRQLIQDLSGMEEIVLVNIQANRRWMNDNNELLKEFQTGDFKNVRIIDWAAISASHREYFVADGIHLTTKGIGAYAGMIRQTLGINSDFLSHAELKHIAKTTEKSKEKNTAKKETSDDSSKVVHQIATLTQPNNSPLNVTSLAIPPVASLSDKQPQTEAPKPNNPSTKPEDKLLDASSLVVSEHKTPSQSIDTKPTDAVITPPFDMSKEPVDNLH